MNTGKTATEKQVAPLLNMLRFAGNTDPAVEKYITENAYPVKIKKGKHLLKPGEICTHNYFIISGVIRSYLFDNKKEITTWITAENEMAAAIKSFIYQVKAIEYVQALEDCELLAISHKTFEDVYAKFPYFNIIARKLYERYYIDAENRALIARLKNAELKYAHFLEVHHQLANRIPLKYIASYMGVTMETLSRLRRKLASAVNVK